MEWFRMKSLYPDDLAIHRAGERAELLFIRGIAWSAASNNDGFIPETQLPRFGLPQTPQRVEALVRENLWLAVDGGYQIRTWDHNQSAEYAAERKRRKDRNRQATRRATVVRQSHDCPQGVAPLEVEEELTPYPPAPQGGSCDGQHDNCRGCKTTRRQRERAEKVWKPPWCGRCDQRTRQMGVNSDAPSRCPDCHPLRASA